MAKRTSASVAKRYLQTKSAKVTHVDDQDVTWGWEVSGMQRMHVMPLFPVELRKACIIFLEDRAGNRTFEAVGDVHQVDLDGLRWWLPPHRDAIESAWFQYCRLRGWLCHDPVESTIALYPGTPGEFRRSLLHVDGVQADEAYVGLQQGRVQVAFRLNRIIWRDSLSCR